MQYIFENEIEIADIYGDIIKEETRSHSDKKIKERYCTTGVSRTGCMFCGYGCHLEKEPNRFQRMAVSHPMMYEYCINHLGMDKALDYIGVNYRPS